MTVWPIHSSLRNSKEVHEVFPASYHEQGVVFTEDNLETLVSLLTELQEENGKLSRRLDNLIYNNSNGA